MTPDELAEIENYNNDYGVEDPRRGVDFRTIEQLCSAIREAWRERDEARARIAELEKLVGQLGVYGPTGGPL